LADPDPARSGQAGRGRLRLSSDVRCECAILVGTRLDGDHAKAVTFNQELCQTEPHVAELTAPVRGLPDADDAHAVQPSLEPRDRRDMRHDARWRNWHTRIGEPLPRCMVDE